MQKQYEHFLIMVYSCFCGLYFMRYLSVTSSIINQGVISILQDEEICSTLHNVSGISD